MMWRILFIVVMMVCVSLQDNSMEATALEVEDLVENTFTEVVVLPESTIKYQDNQESIIIAESVTEDNLVENKNDSNPIAENKTETKENEKKDPEFLSFRKLDPHFFGLGGNMQHRPNLQNRDIKIAVDPASLDNNSFHHAVSWNNKFNNLCGPRKHCSRRLNLVCRRDIMDGHMKKGLCACDSKPEDKVQWSKILENCLAPASHSCISNNICASNNCSRNVCQPVAKEMRKKGLAIATTPVGFIVTFFLAAFIIHDVFISVM